MAFLNKKKVASILEDIGILLELKGENPFKTRAYFNAARTISGLTSDLTDLVESGEIGNIKGIGKALAEKITTLVTTGKLDYYEDLKSEFPPTIFELFGIPGLGPKKIKKLYDTLGIRSLTELEYACNENRLVDLEGFGAKTQDNILKGISIRKKFSEKFHFPVARNAAEDILKHVNRSKGIKRSEIAGSLRRKKEIIGDIDILVSTAKKDAENIMKNFVTAPDIEQVVAEGKTKSSIIMKTGINVDIRVVADKEFPFALHYFTGSKEHNVHMRRIANEQGYKLNEYGLFRESDNARVSCSEEKDIFVKLGLEYIPPELREDTGEIAAAEKGTLPNLIEETDLRGTFHCHTTYSDGANSLEEMLQAAQSRKWEYLGIADHSQSAQYARGLSKADIRRQRKEIDALNEKYGSCRLLHGIESDILADGSLDYDDKTLDEFDFIVVSVHSRFKMTEAEMTKRVIRAIKNKHTTILGHPTGRLLLSRDGYNIDLVQVIDAAADYGKAIEINAHPYRLDLDWRWVKYAKEKGVTICINPDAHNTDGLDDVRYGVGIARKGWLEAGDVLNTQPLQEVLHYLGIS
jgi:DNA polymerase (family X)